VTRTSDGGLAQCSVSVRVGQQLRHDDDGSIGFRIERESEVSANGPDRMRRCLNNFKIESSAKSSGRLWCVNEDDDDGNRIVID
jgi:hypothetical protein